MVRIRHLVHDSAGSQLIAISRVLVMCIGSTRGRLQMRDTTVKPSSFSSDKLSTLTHPALTRLRVVRPGQAHQEPLSHQNENE